MVSSEAYKKNEFGTHHQIRPLMENAPPEDQLVLTSFLGELHQGEVEIAHNSELLFLTSDVHS
jgi:hypothetical protein